MHINVAKDGRRERDKADGNPKEAHIFDVCIVMASEGLRLLFWSKIAGAGGGGASSAPCCAVGSVRCAESPFRFGSRREQAIRRKHRGYLLQSLSA